MELEQAEKMKWLWKGEPTKLVDFHYNQLQSIMRTLQECPRNWFGFSTDEWQSAIALVIKNHHLETYKANSKVSKHKEIINYLKNQIGV